MENSPSMIFKLWKFVIFFIQLCWRSIIVISLVNTFETIILDWQLWQTWNYFLFISLIILAWIRLRTLWSKASKREGGVSMTTLVEHSLAESTESILLPLKMIWLVVTCTCRIKNTNTNFQSKFSMSKIKFIWYEYNFLLRILFSAVKYFDTLFY